MDDAPRAGARAARRFAPAPAALLCGLAVALTGALALGGCDGKSDRARGQVGAEAGGGAGDGQPLGGGLAGMGDASLAVAADEIAASHILVAWVGVRDCPPGVVRTKEEAEERARRIALLLRTDRGDLGDLARRYSDDPTAPRNAGYLGVFRRGEMQAALGELVSSLDEGEIGGPVATPYGWHVVRREPIPKVRLHHLLVAYRGALDADRRVQREPAEAARIAAALQARLSQPGVDACGLAATFSDDPENRHVCGDLGWIEPGFLEPVVERAIFALRPGEVSPVVETVYGFHIFWRP